MNTKEYFNALDRSDPNLKSFSVTVIEGPSAGEKAIVADGSITYLSDPQGFLSSHKDALSALSESGISTLDGSKIYTELIGHRKNMVICGCGHVSLPIIKLAKMTGFYVTAIDDRQEFTSKAKDAGADECLSVPFDEALRSIDGDPFTYFVVVTRGHHWDEVCLKEICKKPSAYIGAMGSKRRMAVVRQNLLKEGVDENIINSFHSPIGLEIGSETPEEIAVSVIGEVISVKNRNKDLAFPSDIMKEILGSEHTQPYSGRMALATIIYREGSAPREVGTKMLITDDGRITNTVGGGLLESRIRNRCLEILKAPLSKPEIFHLALDADAASTEGEVCGGKLDVLLEEI